MLNRLRLLPIVVVIAALALVVRVPGLWSDGDVPIGVTVVQAEEHDEEEEEEVAALEEEDEELGGSIDDEEIGAFPEDEDEGPGATLGVGGSEFSRAEVDMLQNLASRRELLDERERELGLRGNLLLAAEKRIDSKIEELRAMEAQIEELLDVHDEQEESKLRNLVSIYETMKPKEAARIFEELDLDILIDVAQRMNSRRLAPILAKMNPRLAKDVTVEIRTRKELPRSGS